MSASKEEKVNWEVGNELPVGHDRQLAGSVLGLNQPAHRSRHFSRGREIKGQSLSLQKVRS